jgi:hypothetical protein
MKPLTIKISTAGGGTPFIKQLPGMKPVWENCTFVINQDVDVCDLWVVYGGLGTTETARTRATLLITNEPPSVKTFSKTFTRQFDTVLTCPGTTKTPNTLYQQQALPWWVGHKVRADGSDDVVHEKTYDELKSIQHTPKTKLISIIVSNKRHTRGHKQRYDFVQFLKKELGDHIDIFGIGNNSVEDKWDAIAPYKYHIVIENCTYPHYWTEKLSDAFLAHSYPLYVGAPNIHDYFSDTMLSPIDIRKPHEALATIKEIISSDTYERSTEALDRAKDLVLDTYQLFPMLCAYANEHCTDTPAQTITLAPERQSGIVVSMKRCIKALFRLFR